MSEMKHTPGPWVLHEGATHVRIVGSNGENIWFEDKRCPCVMEDARLIAAAPDLLAVIRYAVDNPDFKSDVFDQMARAAIAKAQGHAHD